MVSCDRLCLPGKGGKGSPEGTQTLGLLQKGGCVASPHPVSHFVSMKLQAVFKFGE